MLGGYLFSENVQALISLMGNLAYAAAGLLVAAVIGWVLIRYYRRRR